jgi:energy-coupling factor transport system permease protein
MSASTLYLERPSPLHRAHPLTKLALAGLFLALAITLPDIVWLLVAFALLMLPVSAVGGLLLPFLRSTFSVLWPFVLSLALIQGFFTPGATPLLQLGRFTMTIEGLLAGLTVAARLLLALGGTLLLMLSTRPDKLMLALRQRGLPQALAYIVLTALQIFPRFQERASVILDAQQARGLETEVNVFRRFGLLVPLVGPLILGSIVDVEERAMSLEARAFNYPAPKTSWLILEDSARQALLRTALLLAMLALVAWRIWLAFAA